MATDRRDGEPVKEFRLEGVALFGVVGLIVALVVGSFFAGRWYEHRTPSPSAGLNGIGADPIEHMIDTRVEPPADVDASTDMFDTTDGMESEPSREANRQDPPPTTKVSEPAAAKPAAAAPAAATAPTGDWWVQVASGGDRVKADQLAAALRSGGWASKVFVDGSAFKVRVGAYDTKDQARAATRELVAAGYDGAWVTEVP